MEVLYLMRLFSVGLPLHKPYIELTQVSNGEYLHFRYLNNSWWQKGSNHVTPGLLLKTHRFHPIQKRKRGVTIYMSIYILCNYVMDLSIPCETLDISAVDWKVSRSIQPSNKTNPTEITASGTWGLLSWKIRDYFSCKMGKAYPSCIH